MIVRPSPPGTLALWNEPGVSAPSNVSSTDRDGATNEDVGAAGVARQQEPLVATRTGVASVVHPDAGSPEQQSLADMAAAHAINGCARPSRLAHSRKMAIKRRNMPVVQLHPTRKSNAMCSGSHRRGRACALGPVRLLLRRNVDDRFTEAAVIDFHEHRVPHRKRLRSDALSGTAHGLQAG